MAVFLNKAQRVNPSDKTAPKKWYPVIKSLGRLGEKEVAEELTDELTLNRKEAEMAIYLLQKVVVKGLLDGKTIQLGELGTFRLTLRSEGVENEDEVSAKQIKEVKIRFIPSLGLREKLSKATFKTVESLNNQV